MSQRVFDTELNFFSKKFFTLRKRRRPGRHATFAIVAFGMSIKLFYLFEALGAAANFTSLLLAIRRQPLKWPLGLVGIACFGLIFYKSRLWADVLLQLALFGLSLYGWQRWQLPESTQPIGRLTDRQRWLMAIAVGSGAFLGGLALHRWTPTPTPFPDAWVSVLGATGLGLLARKIIDAWPVLLLTYVCYLGLFTYKGYWLGLGLYGLYTIVAIVAWRQWRSDVGR